MLTNKATAVAVLASMAAQAAAFNSHRHLHNQVDKRDYETEWVTVYETVIVTAGQEAEPTTTQPAVQAVEVPPSSVAEASTTSAAPVVAAPVVAAPVSSSQATTLATSVKKADTNVAAAPTTTTQQVQVEEVAATTAATTSSSTTSSAASVVANAAAKTSSGASASTTSSSSSGAPFSSKRGIAFNDASLANVFAEGCSSCGWAYNWASAAEGLDALSFVPMLWGNREEFTGPWTSNCESAISAGSKAILSFNEPDIASQANMDAASAASLHAQYFNEFEGRALIGAPSVSNSGNAGEGLDWLQSWVDACNALDGGCSYDFCPVHWYSETAYAGTLFEHLEKAHEICGNKPVWLTEFAPLGSDDEISSFLTENIPKLDAVEYLDAYSYFMVSTGSLMSSSTSLSSYGQIYATV
ncbi:Glycosyl hydrolase catalytic core [Geosmithia morbida]|uniref:Glycosyl hydrolase catalytic core n=1 Tax=Geosmithia morbida TaxID=1094350 RepID=A0A9P4YXZ5_9HYPO|nr:Glycosyl hydrolase catalytic core [Geosmithia morbida]KAF4123849.1 Glycosyl hydrolase catalytic core [Geosmithia morbida]